MTSRKTGLVQARTRRRHPLHGVKHRLSPSGGRLPPTPLGAPITTTDHSTNLNTIIPTKPPNHHRPHRHRLAVVNCHHHLWQAQAAAAPRAPRTLLSNACKISLACVARSHTSRATRRRWRLAVTHSRMGNAYVVFISHTVRRSPVPYSFLVALGAPERYRRYLEPCAVGAAEVSLCNQPRSAEDGIPTSVAAAEAYRRALLPTKIRVRRAHPFASAHLSHCISLLPPRPAGLPSPPHGHPDHRRRAGIDELSRRMLAGPRNRHGRGAR